MRRFGKTYWRKRRNKLLKTHVVSKGKVLDVGCGWRIYWSNESDWHVLNINVQKLSL